MSSSSQRTRTHLSGNLENRITASDPSSGDQDIYAGDLTKVVIHNPTGNQGHKASFVGLGAPNISDGTVNGSFLGSIQTNLGSMQTNLDSLLSAIEPGLRSDFTAQTTQSLNQQIDSLDLFMNLDEWAKAQGITLPEAQDLIQTVLGQAARDAVKKKLEELPVNTGFETETKVTVTRTDAPAEGGTSTNSSESLVAANPHNQSLLDNAHSSTGHSSPSIPFWQLWGLATGVFVVNLVWAYITKGGSFNLSRAGPANMPLTTNPLNNLQRSKFQI